MDPLPLPDATGGPAPARVALVTGFDPFDGGDRNPSALVAQALHGRTLAGHAVVGAVLPTEFGRALPALEALMDRHRPAVVLCCGLAGGRAAVSFERAAINLQDARIADNAGRQPVDLPVVPGAPAAYFASVPVKAMREALARAGIPAEVSHTAGTFVCNHVFYGLMHRLVTAGEGGAGLRGGFVHLPWLPGQGTPGLPLDTQVAGLALALECALTTHDDLRQAGGSLH